MCVLLYTTMMVSPVSWNDVGIVQACVVSVPKKVVVTRNISPRAFPKTYMSYHSVQLAHPRGCRAIELGKSVYSQQDAGHRRRVCSNRDRFIGRKKKKRSTK